MKVTILILNREVGKEADRVGHTGHCVVDIRYVTVA